MRRRALVVVPWLLLAAACNKGSAGPAFRFEQPSAVAIFWGYTHKNAGLHPYAAVANTASDELVVFDPVDDVVVSAPILFRPLSIPVPSPRPALVASARFQPAASADGTAGARRPDLLVAVSAGSTELQLVRTWKSGVATVPDPGLASSDPVELGGEVLALVAAPALDGTGAVVADRIQVMAALTGGRLAVVEYAWSGDPAVAPGEGDSAGQAAPASATPATQDLGFDAVSLAVEPPETRAAVSAAYPVAKRFLYAATLDFLLPSPSTVQGVAQLDMSGTPGAWAVQALDAHGPTRLVAAFTLRERVLDVRGGYNQVTALGQQIATGLDVESGQDAFQPAPVARVYALRDPSVCGPATALACGVVVLDPATGDLLENPWNPGASPRDYLPPIAVPAVPVALVAGAPALNPAPDFASTPAAESPEFMLLEAPGNRLTTGVLLLPAEDGNAYFADLARWEVPSSSFELHPVGSQTRVSAFTQSASDLPRIGLYRPPSLPAEVVGGDLEITSNAARYVRLTPGFTPGDVWTISYQGYLPAFEGSRDGWVEDLGAGRLRVSLQTPAPTPRKVVDVYDPALGLRLGDLVELWTTGSGGTGESGSRAGCPDTTLTDNSGLAVSPVEGQVTEIVQPDADHPGGSLVVEPGPCVAVVKGAATVCDADTHGPWNRLAQCWPAGGSPSAELLGTRQVRIRARGGAPGSEELVVTGVATGYAGRATRLAANTGWPQFQLSSADEARAGECPETILKFPQDGLTAPACDEACRAACEAVTIARRARRQHLTSVLCVPGETTCETQSFPDFTRGPDLVPPVPKAPPSGPMLAFSAGIVPNLGTAKDLVRGTQLVISTASGYSAAARFFGGVRGTPTSEPRGAAYFDRTEDLAWDKQSDRYRFFVPYVGNSVLDVSPARSNSDTHLLR